MEKYEALKEVVLGLEQDFSEFFGKGNKAAGRRIRKAMQELKNSAQDIRVDIQARINAQK